jgi:type I restriction enzyme M protein
MANGSLASNTNGEGDIRAAIVDADLVASVVVLPPQLFRSTPIPVCLWFFAKDKTKGKQGAIDRSGQVLFIDARNDPRRSGPNREFGFMVDRAERDLDYENDIKFIGNIFHAWRGSQSATSAYADVPGFCKSVTLAEIKAADYTLQPGRYVGVGLADQDTEPAEEKVARLTASLVAAFEESSMRQSLVRRALERLQ